MLALLSDGTLLKDTMSQELAEKLMANLSVKAEEGEEEVNHTTPGDKETGEH